MANERVLYCVQCKRQLGSYCTDDDAFSQQIETAILSAHATAPHSASHSLQIRDPASVSAQEVAEPRVDGHGCDAPPLSAVADLHVECLMPNCKRTKTMEVKRVPIYLVNACAIAFHASHEGHRFRLHFGDRFSVESPS